MKEFVQYLLARSKSGSRISALICCVAIVLCGTEFVFAENAENAGSMDSLENAKNVENVENAKMVKKPGITFDFSGYVAYQDGEIVKGQYGASTVDILDHQWQNFLFGGFGLTATVNKRLQIVAGTECEVAQAILDRTTINLYAGDLDSYNMFYKFYPDQLRGTYTFGDLDKPFLKATLGYFKFTYDHDAKSLGEYLFRAVSYPGYIIDNFASVYARLPGLCLEFTPVSNLKIDGMLTSETQYPVGDMTPSLLAGYGIGGKENHPLFEVGAGVSLSRIISVNKSLTSPRYQQDLVVVNDTTFTLNNGAVDTTVVSDSVYPSFASTKIMARFSFDPKQFFGGPGIFGDQDLKIYGEGCILGTKNYHGMYPDMGRRTPIMLGFNFPAFKLLDVLSAEVEWYNSQYSNNFQYTYYLPIKAPWPYQNSTTEPTFYPWYWDVYFEKTLIYGLKVMGDIGRTHYFATGNLFIKPMREECPSHGDWQFTLRGQFSF